MGSAEPVILASNSPRRAKLLALLDIPFDTIPSAVEEDYSVDESPEDLVCRVASEKAESVGSLFPEKMVIGADTIVVLDSTIFGKPASHEEAERMLTTLSGKTHSVITGVALVKKSRTAIHTFFEQTDVTFHPLTSNMIDYYVRMYNPLDKAGAYGIQDWSACFVKTISGCYHTVMGFPVSKFAQVLRNRRIMEMFGPYNWFGKDPDRP